MDTDFLSNEAYGIIQCTASFDDTLKSILGESCSDCNNEHDYLQKVLEIIDEIESETSEYLEDWGLEVQFSVTQYRKHLKLLRAKVKEVMAFPENKKTYEEWK